MKKLIPLFAAAMLLAGCNQNASTSGSEDTNMPAPASGELNTNAPETNSVPADTNAPAEATNSAAGSLTNTP